MLDVDQSAEENKREFVARLISAGWSEEEAVAEWNNTQDDEEGNL